MILIGLLIPSECGTPSRSQLRFLAPAYRLVGKLPTVRIVEWAGRLRKHVGSRHLLEALLAPGWIERTSNWLNRHDGAELAAIGLNWLYRQRCWTAMHSPAYPARGKRGLAGLTRLTSLHWDLEKILADKPSAPPGMNRRSHSHHHSNRH